jgi:23S rRNA pseudouridine2605 synthase
VGQKRSLPKDSLARALSKLGVCSRSTAQTLIEAERVRVNGRIEKKGHASVLPDRDRIEVDGRRVSSPQKTYLMLNKPRGLVTTASDEKSRRTVYDCFSGSDFPWLSPVGRLDKASEGLLLFTNDTRWAAAILDPEARLDKTYHVQVKGLIDDEILERMMAGAVAPEGDFLRAKRASLLRRGARGGWLEVVLDEGRNRHIRRLLNSLGIEVIRLLRVAIGPLPLGELAKGAHRRLTTEEVKALTFAARPRTRHFVKETQ